MAVRNHAEIISIGTEILMGEITDTNAGYLSTELQLLGMEPGRITAVGDDRTQLCQVLQQAMERSEVVVASGGLGPTADDLTRECVAEVLGESPAVDAQTEKDLRAFFQRFGRDMPESNLKQAMLIPSARGIPNPLGTAPGWWVEKDGRVIVLLPGPPREMGPMWQNAVKPLLNARFPGSAVLTRTLKTFGLSEAGAGEMVASFFQVDNPGLGIYARSDGIHLRLIARGDASRELLDRAEKQMRQVIGEYVWGCDSDTVQGVVGRLLTDKGLSLAVMEDGTRGEIAGMITGVGGPCGYYLGGLIACSDGVKVKWGVPPDVLSRCGPISAEVAGAMAVAVRQKFGADIGLSITGIVGLDSSDDRPRGLTFIGLADKQGQTGWQQVGLPHRDIARSRAAVAALFRLRQRLLQ